MSKGYLPPELFPLSFLKNITTSMAHELQKDRRGYRLAFDHDSAYYDMQLATFSLDEFHNLVVTFPVFIVPLDHHPFHLYELEMVPVPIDNQDDHASSFSEVMINKTYFTATDTAYIQVRTPELFRCKVIQGQYFCEGTFILKHAHHHTCESAIFYDRDSGLITSTCAFQFYHNRTVTPSVLDGSETLALANVKIEHSLTCDPRLLQNIPRKTYTLAPRSVLCNCTLQSDLSYIPSDLGACNNTMGPIEFQSQPNLAFETIFQDILSLNERKGDKVTPLHKEITGSDFPINLTLPFNAPAKINTLQEAYSIFTKCWDKRMSKNNSDVSYILTDHYQKQISLIRDLIDENHKEQFLASHYSEILQPQL